MLFLNLDRRTYTHCVSSFVLLLCLLPGSLTAQNQNWLPGFSSSGLSERALADGADNINVVGQFTVATAGFFQGPGPDGLRNYSLAIWNGEYWRLESPTDTSFGDLILTAAPLFFDICIGGTFTPTDFLPGSHVNCWNGREWYEPGGPGSGPDGQVSTLTFDGEDIYAGGFFSLVGSTAANNIAQFDRDMNQWRAMAGGTSGAVNALVSAAPAVSIYVGGAFDNAGGRASTQGIARWDPVARSWQEVGGGGVNGIGTVSDLSADGGFIYAAGGFSSLGGVAVDRVARTVVGSDTWAPLGAPANIGNAVDQIQVTPGGDVFAHGPFNAAQSVLARYIPGSGLWVEPPGLDGLTNSSGGLTVTDMDAFGSNLYIAHRTGFQDNTIYAPFYARFDGQSWHGLGSGIGGYGFATDWVYAIQDFGKDVIVGGSFDIAGDSLIPLAASWDGESWTQLAQGLERRNSADAINAIDQFAGDIYLGGQFGYEGNAESILQWDGNQFNELPNTLDTFRVNALDASGSFLFVGGSFNVVPTDPLGGIATFNGTQWQSLGGGANGEVEAIRVVGADVYIGGSLFGVNQNSQSINNVAHWNGSTWNDLAGGVTGNAFVSAPPVSDIEVSGTDVYFGGNIASVGGFSVNNIARWDGTQWHALGEGVNGVIYDMAMVGSNLFVTGNFTSAGGEPANGIALWNGSSWNSLGWGLQCSCTNLGRASGAVLYERADSLWVGGQFNFAGPHLSNNLARFDLEGVFDSNFETNTAFGNP